MCPTLRYTQPVAQWLTRCRRCTTNRTPQQVFFADLDAGDRLRILGVRRQILEARIAHMESLRPDAQAEPWGLRVMDFSIGRYRDELAWLDALAVAATGG